MTSRFWQALSMSLGTQLNISSTYHLETDGQIERINQVLEDLLMVYAWINNISGRIIFHLWNFLITILIIVQSKWLHLKHYIEGNAKLL